VLIPDITAVTNNQPSNAGGWCSKPTSSI